MRSSEGRGGPGLVGSRALFAGVGDRSCAAMACLGGDEFADCLTSAARWQRPKNRRRAPSESRDRRPELALTVEPQPRPGPIGRIAAERRPTNWRRLRRLIARRRRKAAFAVPVARDREKSRPDERLRKVARGSLAARRRRGSATALSATGTRTLVDQALQASRR
jgi:hypothetical protein